jgi:hypothetical protein
MCINTIVTLNTSIMLVFSLTLRYKILNIVVMIMWWLELQLPVQSVPITTKVVSSNSVHGEVYSIQHYMIKFVSDLWQVGGFLHQ